MSKQVLQGRFLSYIFAAVVLTSIVWALAYHVIRIEREERFTQSAHQAKHLSAFFEQQVLHLFRYSNAYLRGARRAYIKHGGLAAVREMMADIPLDQSIVSHLTIIDETGTPLLVSGHNIKPGTTAKDRDYFTFLQRSTGDAIFISLSQRGRNSGQQLIRMARRINKPNGRFAGVIFAAVEGKKITEFFQALNLGSQSSAILVGTDKRVRARFSHGRLGTGQDVSSSRLWQELEARPVGLYRQTSVVDGIVRYYAYRRLAEFPLIVSVGIAIDDIATASTRFEFLVLLITTLSTLVIVGMTVLIARKNLVRQTIQAGETRLRTIVDSVDEGILTVDERGHIESFNHGAQKMFGYVPEVIIGQDVAMLADEPDRSQYAQDVQNYLTTDPDKIMGCGYREVRARRQDGTVFPAELSVGEMRLGLRRLFVVVMRDITDRKHAEATLTTRVAQLEAVRDVSAEITRELNLNVLFELIIRRVIELTGATSGAIHLLDEAEQVLITRAHYGAKKIDLSGLRNKLGEGLVGLVAARRQGLNVDNYQQASGALSHIASQVGSISILLEPMLYRERLVGVITCVHREGCPFSADDQALLAVFATQSAIAIENARLFEESRQRQRRLSSILEINKRIAGSEEVPNLFSRIAEEAARFIGADGASVRIRQNDRLVLVGTTQAGLAIKDMASLSLEDGVAGRTVTEDRVIVVPDIQTHADVVPFYKARAAQAGLCSLASIPIRGAAGVVGLMSITSKTPRTFSEDETAALSTYAEQAAIAIENIKLVDAMRQQARHLAQTNAALQDEIKARRQAEGQIARHNQELERAVQETTREMETLMARMVGQEKLATIGQVAGSIAHELRNPLGVIKQSLFFLNRLYHTQRLDVTNPKVPDHLKLIESELDVSDRVITQLLAFARHQPPKLEWLELRALMTETLRGMRWREEMSLTVTCEPDPFMLWADRWYMQHVLLNLLRNAADACEFEGAVTVSASVDLETREYVLTVADTGCGIAAEDLAYIFEPLYSRKVWGTGLGLSLCKQLIEQLRGVITVASQVGQGTTFTLRLPLPPATAALVKAAPTASVLERHDDARRQ